MLPVSPMPGEEDFCSLTHRAVQACCREGVQARAIDSWYAIYITDMLDGAGPVPIRMPEPGPPEKE